MMQFWWVGQRLIDCVGLHTLAPLNTIICCDYGIESPEVMSKVGGAYVFSLERENAVRRAWSNYSIEEAIDRFISSHIGGLSQAQAVAVLYRSSSTLEQIVKQSSLGLRIAAPSAHLVSRLDDKFYTFLELTQAGIAQPKGRVCDLTRVSYKELVKDLGERMVIKQRMGASGSGTHFALNKEEFDDLIVKLGSQLVLVTQFIEGLSYNIHAVITNGHILVSSPSVQLVGTQGCTNRREVYCGNDYSAFVSIDSSISDAISLETRKIGQWMMLQGYRGIFGIDFVGTGGHVVALDINPRFQGSTSLMTQAEIVRGHFPTIAAHISEFVDFSPNSHRILEGQVVQPLAASQIILHSLYEHRVFVRKSMTPGVYHLDDEHKLTFIRSGLSLFDCLLPGEFVITCGIPRNGTAIDPGASLLKIIASRSVTDLETGGLIDEAANVIQQVYAQFEMSDSID